MDFISKNKVVVGIFAVASFIGAALYIYNNLDILAPKINPKKLLYPWYLASHKSVISRQCSLAKYLSLNR